MPMVSVDSATIGKAKRYGQALGRYIEFVSQHLINRATYPT